MLLINSTNKNGYSIVDFVAATVVALISFIYCIHDSLKVFKNFSYIAALKKVSISKFYCATCCY